MEFLTALRYWREISIAVLIGVGIMSCRARDAHIAADAVRADRLTIAESRAAAFEQAAAHRDTVFVTDTLRLTKLVAHYDTARVRDTLVRNDTVFVEREAADQAVAGCKIAVSSCAAALEAERDVSGNLREQLAAVAPAPGFWHRQYERWDGPAGLLIGLIAGSR